MSDPVRVPTTTDEPPARAARPPRVLLVRAGKADDSVRAAHGDYTDWFERALAPHGVEVEAVAAFDGEVLPYGGAYEGIIITGSASSVRDEAPWMPMVGQWALSMAAHTPVLAVCFGHQLVGERLGGRVEAHRDGPEWGTVDVQLTDAGRRDPLFEGLPDVLRVQGLHRDHVAVEPDPARFTRLAGNAHTPLQAFGVGPWLRAVQFHPELRADALDFLLDARGWTATAPVEPTDHGERLLGNWVEHYVRRAERD